MASFKRRKYVHMATEISQYSILCGLYRGDVFFFVEAILTKLAIQKGENWSLRFFMGAI
jgi:hypothetical protein